MAAYHTTGGPPASTPAAIPRYARRQCPPAVPPPLSLPPLRDARGLRARAVPPASPGWSCSTSSSSRRQRPAPRALQDPPGPPWDRPPRRTRRRERSSFIVEPSHLRHILVDNARNYAEGVALAALRRPLAGARPLHERRRPRGRASGSWSSPLFSSDQPRPILGGDARERTRPRRTAMGGAVRLSSNEPVDVAQEMIDLALDIVVETLLGAEAGQYRETLRTSFGTMIAGIEARSFADRVVELVPLVRRSTRFKAVRPLPADRPQPRLRRCAREARRGRLPPYRGQAPCALRRGRIEARRGLAPPARARRERRRDDRQAAPRRGRDRLSRRARDVGVGAVVDLPLPLAPPGRGAQGCRGDGRRPRRSGDATQGSVAKLAYTALRLRRGPPLVPTVLASHSHDRRRRRDRRLRDPRRRDDHHGPLLHPSPRTDLGQPRRLRPRSRFLPRAALAVRAGGWPTCPCGRRAARVHRRELRHARDPHHPLDRPPPDDPLPRPRDRRWRSTHAPLSPLK